MLRRPQHRVLLLRGNTREVHRHRDEAAGDGPDVEVVNCGHVGERQERGPDLIYLDVSGVLSISTWTECRISDHDE